MATKDLKKLSRAELLELLIEQTDENRKLTEEIDELRKKLADKILTCDESGSLAEAAIKLNGVFEAAQAACDQYIANIHFYNNADAVAKTEEQCEKMIADARAEARAYWDAVNSRIEEIMNKSETLRRILTESGVIRDPFADE